MTSLSRKFFFDAVHSAGTIADIDSSCNICIDALRDHHRIQQFDDKYLTDITKTFKSFLYRLRERWNSPKCKRYVGLFTAQNTNWLNQKLTFSDETEAFIGANSRASEPSTAEETASTSVETASTSVGPGRPPKTWGTLSDRSKKRKAHELLEEREPAELLYTASQGMYTKDDNLRYVLKFAMLTPSRPEKVRKLISEKKTGPQRFSSEEALSLLVETDMTKQAYQTQRLAAKSKNADIYPPYNEVREAKNKCYPDNIEVSEGSAKVSLQSLLDHTTLRIVQQEKEKITELIENLDDGEELECSLICKWGFDGSSGQSEYKQKFSSADMDDSSLFCTTLVPLQLKHKDIVIWENPVPSSSRFCRPIHLQFKKETTALSQSEYSMIESEISNLTKATINLDIDYELAEDENRNDNVQVTYDLHFTMADQKVLNALTETASSMRCYVCGATPKVFNDLDNLPAPKEETYKYGLSPLHKWIRTFEMLLHIAYRIPIKQWRVSGDKDKAVVAAKKKEIHDKFKSVMGLKVDEPKQGAGNTNDGNTARRAFHQEQEFADICGLDHTLVHRLHTVLVAISCKCALNPEKVDKYCQETAELLVSLYPWYKMPVSVHILLIHGGSIINNSLLPIGMMSEESQEARNKDNKLFRRKHARKTSRVDNMSDVFHRLMVTGDIVISSLSLKSPQAKPLPREVRDMLKDSDVVLDEDSSDSD